MNSENFGACAMPIVISQSADSVEDKQGDSSRDLHDSRPEPFFHRWLDDWKRHNEAVKP
jgi:hypothetical protein